jgi:hypothetical protein
MNKQVEAAAMTQQVSRGIAAPGMVGFMGTGALPAPGVSSFAEVANDADFDLTQDVEMLDATMRSMIETGRREQLSPPPAEGSEDDFVLGDGTGSASYELSEPISPEVPLPPASEANAQAPIAAAPEAHAGKPPADVSHSVQTGGDVLLDAALEEERDTAQRQKLGHRRLRRSTTTAQSGDRFLVFCPNGHRIQVQARHRGRTGRCPSCRSLFFVPTADASATVGEAGGAVQGHDAPAGQEETTRKGYSNWLTEIRLHKLQPARLKLRPGSLSAEFDPVDLGFSAEHLLLAVLHVAGGPFGALQAQKKKAATRQAMLEHLTAQLPLADLPVPRHIELTVDALSQLKFVQPSVPGEESLFADVPVFGEGRIALRVPAGDSPGERAYLSFTLSQFREFSRLLADVYGLADFGAGTSIPLTDDFVESNCHYSEATLRSLANERLAYYRADSAFKVAIIGRRCARCGLVVSEDSRKKEKIGGKSDSSVAKAKCPKCKQKFGDQTLFGLSQA